MAYRRLQGFAISTGKWVSDYWTKEEDAIRKWRRIIAEEVWLEEEDQHTAEKHAQDVADKLKNLQKILETDEAMKIELRHWFIKELMHEQEVSGTFEATSGTITPFKKYDAEDPVAKWFAKVKGDPIEGKDWDALYDAEYFKNGISGWRTDEAAIIAVVSTRSNAQRNSTLLQYKSTYKKDLIEDLKGDLSDTFFECILALFEIPARYDAWSIKKAIYELGTDESTLIEILMSRTNAQIKEMTKEYNNITYKNTDKGDSSFEMDIKDDTSRYFKDLLIAVAKGNRKLITKENLAEAVVETGKGTGMLKVDYNKLLDMGHVDKLARELYDAGENYGWFQWGTNEDTFIRIFATEDYHTMRSVWYRYAMVSQNDIETAVDSETSGPFREGLLAILQIVRSRPMFFAERLYKSIQLMKSKESMESMKLMKSMKSKDDEGFSTLLRICVSRSEIDMEQIKSCFKKKYQKSLSKCIMEETSGDYRKLLCSIVGKN